MITLLYTVLGAWSNLAQSQYRNRLIFAKHKWCHEFYGLEVCQILNSRNLYGWMINGCNEMDSEQSQR